jgi:hypothetical protein
MPTSPVSSDLPNRKTHTIFLYPDGTVAHLHDDDFVLPCFGRPTIRRASHVEPNADSTTWEVRLPDSGTLIATADRRDHALAQEVEQLNTVILPTRSSALDPL